MRDPKQYLGTNSQNIKLLIADSQLYQKDKDQLQTQLPQTDEQQPSTSGEPTNRTKKPKMYLDIETLLQLMRKYQTPDKIQLLRETTQSENTQDQQNLKDLIRSNNWNIIYKKSQEEFDFINTLKEDEQSYFHTFMTTVDDTRQKTMNYQNTVKFFNLWTFEQGINTLQFIMEIYCVIRMYHPKRNTFYMQGTSNAGKTYILESLVPHKDKVGQHITSRDFMFQECLNKPVILINELTLQNQTESETYKNILGGEPTYINLKNRNGEILYRKPVFLTSNLPIWRFVSNDREPLMNRMFTHMHLTTSKVIKQFTTQGVPSTEYWKVAFSNLKEIEELKQIPKNEKFMELHKTFSENLTPDAQTITSEDMLQQDWPPSPIPQDPQNNNNSNSTTLEETTQQQQQQQQLQQEIDRSCQTGQSVMDTSPIETIPQPPTNKTDHQTQTQQLLEIAFYDPKEDDKNNPMSSLNINQNTAHDSDNDTPEEEQLQVHISPPRINISTPPNSPDNDPDQNVIQQSPTVPLGPLRRRRNTFTLRRRQPFQHSTPNRPRRHTPGSIVFDTTSGSENDTSIDMLLHQL